VIVSILTALFLIAGAFFAFVAALGLVRLPDLPMRMHAATKAGTLGAGFVLVGVAIAFGESAVTLRALATIAFLFLTAPVAAHLMARAAYYAGQMPLWEGTLFDELRSERDDAREAPSADPTA
jgi:multicomponent Na+:H+ antiporter subunit G